MSVASPSAVLEYWIGSAKDDPGLLPERHKIWFGKNDVVDQDIANRFLETLRILATGGAEDWANRDTHARLAAIIVLDQFSRNLFRGNANAFAQDGLALGLCKDGLMKGVDKTLTEVERAFFYLPLEHSERQADQALCVSLMQKLADNSRPGFQDFAKQTADYARRHKEVIDRFGRFPHRNSVLGRPSTPEEIEFLKQPGSRF